jgi:hypothetical protein
MLKSFPKKEVVPVRSNMPPSDRTSENQGWAFAALVVLGGIIALVIIVDIFRTLALIASWVLMIAGGFVLAQQFMDDRKGVQITTAALLIGAGVVVNIFTR